MSTANGNEIRILVPIEKGQRFTCNVCNHSSSHRYNFTKHVEEHLSVPIAFVCRVCSWQTAKYRMVQYHEHCKARTPTLGFTEVAECFKTESDALHSTELVASCPLEQSPFSVNSSSSNSTSSSFLSALQKVVIFEYPAFKLAIHQMSVILDLEVHHDCSFEYVLEEKETTFPKMLSITETATHILVNAYKSDVDEIVEESWASNDPDLVVYAIKFKCLSLFRGICC